MRNGSCSSTPAPGDAQDSLGKVAAAAEGIDQGPGSGQIEGDALMVKSRAIRSPARVAARQGAKSQYKAGHHPALPAPLIEPEPVPGELTAKAGPVESIPGEVKSKS